MSVACDYCGLKADRHDDVIFVAAPSGLCHICEVCADWVQDVVKQTKTNNPIT